MDLPGWPNFRDEARGFDAFAALFLSRMLRSDGTPSSWHGRFGALLRAALGGRSLDEPISLDSLSLAALAKREAQGWIGAQEYLSMLPSDGGRFWWRQEPFPAMAEQNHGFVAMQAIAGDRLAGHAEGAIALARDMYLQGQSLDSLPRQPEATAAWARAWIEARQLSALSTSDTSAPSGPVRL